MAFEGLSSKLQDFTRKSDIDWSKEINEIDKQLYKKYRLTEFEINYIENKIKDKDKISKKESFQHSITGSLSRLLSYLLY